MADYSPTGLEVVVYRPHHVFHRLTLDLTAACDLARVFQTMLAAVHASQITRRGHMADYSPTGLEVVVYRPHRFFHGLTLDITVACDIARMFQSPSAALIYVDNSNLRVLNIHAELLNGNDGVQTQIVADETVIVDSEKQSCDDIFSLGESCNQQQTDVTAGLDTSHERDVEKEGSHAFLFDEDIAKLPYVEPMRPQQLVKWEELSDVTDHGLDIDQVEGWDVTEMFATNEADFGFKSTFDETLSEYTTLLVKEATPDYQLRWERACRLADEIEGKKKAEQANRTKQPKKRKKKNRRSKKSGCPY
ncbi:putative ataxin-2-like protein-like [Apostichopus japonicus]|uniref:Putative ataxin-2-like protein-like n=1 Tax=Stichopus japonicus TaxID=307972 RepID=A0A2G8JZ05_STIJA|nr:putative ataxin-2-like protein-like [Apostichopus japonicus]